MLLFQQGFCFLIQLVSDYGHSESISVGYQVYCKVSGNARPEVATIDVTSQEFYGVGYDDSELRIPDMTIIKRQLGINSSDSEFALL